MTDQNQFNGPRFDRKAVLQRAFDLAQIAEYCYQLDGTITYIDRMAVRILDLENTYPDPSSLIGMNISELLVYEWPVGKLREEILEKGNAYHTVYPFKTLSGKERWMLHDSCIATDPDTGKKFIQAVVRDITNQKLAEREIARVNRRLRNLARHMESVREEERTAIARDIHDEIGQSLIALTLDLSAIKKHLTFDLRKKTDSMLEAVKTILSDIRRIVTGLRPAGLDDLGLVAAVEWELESLAKRTGIKGVFTAPDGDISLDEKRRTAAFRIIQESLTNVIRHAQATRVEVSLKVSAAMLIITVTDDGVGISGDSVASDSSFGLIGMRERVIAVNGTISANSVPGRGTTISATIPLNDL